MRKTAFWTCSLVVLCALFLPGIVLADSPTPESGDIQCSLCHATEWEAWQNSTHANIGVDCTFCHGPFSDDHPESAMMELGIESTICQDCHADTYDQWASSLHAKKGVQCIGCHLSHSQEFRLTDEALCGSCHRDVLESYTHSLHNSADITCVTCHASAPAEDGDSAQEGASVPSHQFVVESSVCIGCHGESIHQPVVESSSDYEITLKALQDVETEASRLGARIQELESANRRLQTLSLAGLGLGLGGGGMAGIVIMLIIGYVTQGRNRK